MTRRSFAAAIAAFFGLGGVAKAVGPYRKAEEGYRLDPPRGMRPQEPDKAFRRVYRRDKGLTVGESWQEIGWYDMRPFDRVQITEWHNDGRWLMIDNFIVGTKGPFRNNGVDCVDELRAVRLDKSIWLGKHDTLTGFNP